MIYLGVYGKADISSEELMKSAKDSELPLVNVVYEGGYIIGLLIKDELTESESLDLNHLQQLALVLERFFLDNLGQQMNCKLHICP